MRSAEQRPTDAESMSQSWQNPFSVFYLKAGRHRIEVFYPRDGAIRMPVELWKAVVRGSRVLGEQSDSMLCHANAILACRSSGADQPLETGSARLGRLGSTFRADRAVC